MVRSDLLKILLIELAIVTFIKFQVLEEKNNVNFLFEGKPEEKDEKTEESAKNDNNDKSENNKQNFKADIYGFISKGKEFAGSIRPYLSKKEQYYIDMFTKIAEITEIQKSLTEISDEEINAMDETGIDHIGILKAVKPYMADDKQDIIEKFLKLHEAVKNIHEKMDKYVDKDIQNTNPFDRIFDIYEALKPIIPDDKKEIAEKVIKNIKLVDALNKAEGIMSSMKNTDKKAEEHALNRFDIHNGNEKVQEKIDDKVQKDKEVFAENANEVSNKDKNNDINASINDHNSNQSDNSQELSLQQAAMIDSLKSMLTKEQQQYMYNMINYLKQQGAKNNNET